MADGLDLALLRGRRSCDFCDWDAGEEDAHLHLLLHSLSEHPLEYLLLKDLTGAGHSFSAADLRQPLTPLQVLSSVGSPSPSPSGLGSPALGRRRHSPPSPLPRLGLSALGVEAEGVRAERCDHNRRPCRLFPRCAGRLCPLRHPRCPDPGSRCLRHNDCPFYHPEYEMTCDRCPLRPQPGQFRPHVIHCPHRKLRDCRTMPCLRAMRCRDAHGLCKRPGCNQAVNCPFDHPNFYYFCTACRELLKK